MPPDLLSLSAQWIHPWHFFRFWLRLLLLAIASVTKTVFASLSLSLIAGPWNGVGFLAFRLCRTWLWPRWLRVQGVGPTFGVQVRIGFGHGQGYGYRGGL